MLTLGEDYTAVVGPNTGHLHRASNGGHWPAVGAEVYRIWRQVNRCVSLEVL